MTKRKQGLKLDAVLIRLEDDVDEPVADCSNDDFDDLLDEMEEIDDYAGVCGFCDVSQRLFGPFYLQGDASCTRDVSYARGCVNFLNRLVIITHDENLG